VQGLAVVTVELDPTVRSEIWRTRASSAQLRIEEIAERHLRTMLELRY
jgi:hypothetical protein